MFNTIAFAAWITYAASLLLAVSMHQYASKHYPNQDAGIYWSKIAAYCVIPQIVLLLISWLLFNFTEWPALYFDQITDSSYFEHIIALLLPFGMWWLAVFITPKLKLPSIDNLHWLAGGVGFTNSRRWLLWPSSFLLGLLFLNTHKLDNSIAFPTVVWSILAITGLTLLGAAFSRCKTNETIEQNSVSNDIMSKTRTTWPELMKQSGFNLLDIAFWPAFPEMRKVNDRALFFANRLKDMGANRVAPELIETASALINTHETSNDGYGVVRIVFSSDHCGEIEVITLMAKLLEQKNHTVTLIITPNNAHELAKQIKFWLPNEPDSVQVLGFKDIADNSNIWIIETETLSDQLLPKFKDSPNYLAKIGLVVWWRMHDYSGVMAANLWAITRRLHRLLRAHGQENLRTFAFLHSDSPQAQSGDFVRRLLPHEDLKNAETRIYVQYQQHQPIDVHLLIPNTEQTQFQKYTLLRAASISIANGWQVSVSIPDFISSDEFRQFCSESVNQQTLTNQLIPTLELAEVFLFSIRAADILTLPNLISQIGRSIVDNQVCHVGIIPPLNPYATYLLGKYTDHTITASRRLICAKSCRSIVKRHLLLALNELSDTRSGLLQNAMWDEDTVDEAVASLAQDDKLNKEEVRYLGENNRLIIDLEFYSKISPDDKFRPLNTVGSKLILIRERAGGDREGGIRLRVDPERLLIMAYPGRIFMHQGQRYRINEWSDIDENLGELECWQEAQNLTTWRCYTSLLYSINSLEGKKEVEIGKHGRLTRLAVELAYQEQITGRIEWNTDVNKVTLTNHQHTYLRRMSNKPFKTKGVVLSINKNIIEESNANALPSLCQVLRHVLPVHLAVEEDALAVVSLNGLDRINGKPVFGMAIIDLFPGGIGLVEAIYDDDDLWLNILQCCHDWLMNCREETLQNHPYAFASSADQQPQPQAALNILKFIL